MAEQWIAAHQAYDSAPDQYVLCDRLHAALIPARARLFQFGEEVSERCQVPKWFWWAGGHEALEADWTSGDFSTWIEHRTHCRAFGVEFGLAGVLEMLPFEDRAATARRLSVAGNPDWISAKEARKIACEYLGYAPVVAGDAIIELARLGLASARAIMAVGTKIPARTSSTWQEREWDVPVWFWNDLAASRENRGFWELGQFQCNAVSPHARQKIVLSGVHFLRSSIIPDMPSAAIPEPEGAIRRGRKPSYDWDAAVSAIWGDIYRGDLNPAQQADIELAIQRWLTRGDREPSESTVRPYAKRIWDEFSKA